MTRLVFVDVDDTLLTPPYAAVKRVATWMGKKFPAEEAFLNRPHVDYHKAFPGLFRSSAEMWAVALLSLPFGHFRSQAAMPLDVARLAELLADQRLYLISKNPPSFTRWRVERLRELFSVRMGDRYIACGPILKKGESKLSIIEQVARDRGVALTDCLLVDDSVENLQQAARAGVACVLVRSSWNEADSQSLQQLTPTLQVVETPAIPQVIAAHLGETVELDRPTTFVVPPLTPANVVRLGWTFLKRRWLFAEPLPKLRQIVPVARNPWTSLLFKDPHAAMTKRLEGLLAAPEGLLGLRILPLRGNRRPILLPLALRRQLEEIPAQERVRYFRTVCRDLLASRGHSFVRDAMFYFTELNRVGEKARILRSDRVAEAKRSYLKTHNVSEQEVEGLAKRYADELLTSRSYVSCLFGEYVLDTILTKILKKIDLKTHPKVRELEGDHFLFYAATHRSYLDSAVLWSLLSHNGQSFPFAVGADKMRKVWFGRLGIRGGTFFLRRKFIDVIYAATIAEHVSAMQKPGSVIEVFLEGQRSRSGLTLPPKKGIASIVWENMGPNDKVAIVPVSFTYNKLPESEKLIKERYDERQKLGVVSLREVADMKIRQARRKSGYDKFRSAWRRLRSPRVSDCYVHFAEPIVLDKSGRQGTLQENLNEAMRRINVATAVLPSSVLCLYLLGADEGHSTRELAAEFLRFSQAVVDLYQLPKHLAPCYLGTTPEADVEAFVQLPFVNRKFKRAGMVEDTLVAVDDLDIERASYYKNNVLHFFVLPAILSYVLTDVHSGRIEELHRCFDHMFAKLQATYFLPSVASTHAFIDTFVQLLAERDLIVVANNCWVTNGEKSNAMLLRVLARLGAELVKGDLPNLLDAIRRSNARKDVHVPSRLAAMETTTHAAAKVVDLTPTEFYVQCDAKAQLGDRVEFAPDDAALALSGVIVKVDAGGVAVRHEPLPAAPPASLGGGPASHGAEGRAGKATFQRAQAASGVINNLSPSGAFITTELRLKAGDRLSCSLGQQAEAYVVHGRVARVTEAGVGVCFENLTEEGKARVVLLSVGPA